LLSSLAGSGDYQRWKSAAAVAQDAAITVGTRAQRRWRKFLEETGQEWDPFLERLDAGEMIELFACFAAAIWEGWPRDTGKAVGASPGHKASSVCAGLDGVAQAFRTHKLGSPIHDSRGQLDPLLTPNWRIARSRTPKQSDRKPCPQLQ
jgi:hypothetical protein